MSKKLTRKEVAGMVGVSTESVRRNEGEWGLTKAKVKANSRLIWYEEKEALTELRERRLIG